MLIIYIFIAIILIYIISLSIVRINELLIQKTINKHDTPEVKYEFTYLLESNHDELKLLPPHITQANIILTGEMAPIYKKDWEEIDSILKKYKVNAIYHITDYENLDSILSYGALVSWSFAESHKLEISRPGGNDLSRTLDKRHKIENYVRLSFTKNLPMIHYAIRENRITNPYVLEFNPKIVYFKDTRFCPINAADNDAVLGDDINVFKLIKFDHILNNGFISNRILRKYRQAEVLVKDKLTLDFLLKEPYKWRI